MERNEFARRRIGWIDEYVNESEHAPRKLKRAPIYKLMQEVHIKPLKIIKQAYIDKDCNSIVFSGQVHEKGAPMIKELILELRNVIDVLIDVKNVGEEITFEIHLWKWVCRACREKNTSCDCNAEKLNDKN